MPLELVIRQEMVSMIRRQMAKEFKKKDITEEKALGVLNAVVLRDVFVEDLAKIEKNKKVLWLYKGEYYTSRKLAYAIIEKEELDYENIKKIMGDNYHDWKDM